MPVVQATSQANLSRSQHQTERDQRDLTIEDGARQSEQSLLVEGLSVRENDKESVSVEAVVSKDRATRQAETNGATLQAYQDVKLGAKSEPLSLTYKAAIEAINKELEPELGPNASEKAFDAGIDFSPEATAGRIVTFSTAFFHRYQEQHEDKDLATQVNDFIELLRGGVDQGFGEAREILDGLGVLEGEIEENIDRTYDLVFEGYERFKQEIIRSQNGAPEQTEQALADLSDTSQHTRSLI